MSYYIFLSASILLLKYMYLSGYCLIHYFLIYSTVSVNQYRSKLK